MRAAAARAQRRARVGVAERSVARAREGKRAVVERDERSRHRGEGGKPRCFARAHTCLGRVASDIRSGRRIFAEERVFAFVSRAPAWPARPRSRPRKRTRARRRAARRTCTVIVIVIDIVGGGGVGGRGGGGGSRESAVAYALRSVVAREPSDSFQSRQRDARQYRSIDPRTGPPPLGRGTAAPRHRGDHTGGAGGEAEQATSSDDDGISGDVDDDGSITSAARRQDSDNKGISRTREAEDEDDQIEKEKQRDKIQTHMMPRTKMHAESASSAWNADWYDVLVTAGT